MTSNSGFYNYDEKGKRNGFWEGLQNNFDILGVQPDLDTIKERVRDNKDLFGRGIKYSKLEFSEKHYPEYLIKNRNLYEIWII